MTATIVWRPELVRTIEPYRRQPIRQKRVGVALHYDGSTTDVGSLSWFADPRCRGWYQAAVLDDGTWARIAADDERAWHLGVSEPSERAPDYWDGNSAFYGVAACTNDKVDVTPLQLMTVAWLVRRYFALHGWDPVDDAFRVVGHSSEAMPRGRKTDPEGGDPKNPIFSPDDVLQLLPLIDWEASCPGD